MHIVAQERPEVLSLLSSLGLEAVTYPARQRGITAAIRSLRDGWCAVDKAIRRFRPDRVFSIAGAYTARPARRHRIFNALITDTETATLSHLVAYPYADIVFHPSSYRIEMDRVGFLTRGKREFFSGRQEASYACSEPFRRLLDMASTPSHPFAFLRAIAWQAFHEERNRGGWTEVVSALKQAGLEEIVASMETNVPEQVRVELAPWAYCGDPIHYHAHLWNARLVVTEGATTATECVIYGTPVIFVNAHLYGTIADAVREGRARHAKSLREAAAIVAQGDCDAWRKDIHEHGDFCRQGPFDLLFGSRG